MSNDIKELLPLATEKEAKLIRSVLSCKRRSACERAEIALLMETVIRAIHREVVAASATTGKTK